jgi:Ca2+-binding RTX toxin-like protein
MNTSTRTTIEPLPTTDLADALNDTLDRIITQATENTNAVKAPMISSFAQIFGTGGADNIHGTAADDQIFASGGNDTIEGGEGHDTIDAGDGDDYVDSHSGGNDVFYGGAGNDFYYGYTGNEKIYGDWGNDTLKGYLGDDVLEGGMGADYLDGGTGWDWASYSTSKTGVSASLLLNAGFAGDANGDQLYNIESLTGSKFGDYLAGNHNSNVLDGGAGNDLLNGYDGWDNVYGGDGDDTIDGGNGVDYLSGGAGADTFKMSLLDGDGIDGGTGSDWLDLSGTKASDPYWGFVVKLDEGKAYDQTNATKQISLSNIENVNALGATKESVYGNAADNTMLGGFSDYFSAAGGNDTMILKSFGKVYFDGGEGIDTIDYSASNTSVILTLDTPYDTGAGAGDNSFALHVENIIGGKVGDSLFGSNANNDMKGMAGDDWITGGYGGDTLTGGSGKDEFRFNATSDSWGEAAWATRDRITDFTRGQDHIDVWNIDANANINGNQSFNYLGDKAFTAAGQIRSYFEGDHTIVEFNTVDAPGAEMVIELSGHVSLSAYDFVL